MVRSPLLPERDKAVLQILAETNPFKMHMQAFPQECFVLCVYWHIDVTEFILTANYHNMLK